METDLKKEIENITIIKSVDVYEKGNDIKNMIKYNDDKIIMYSTDLTFKILDPLNNYNCDFTAKLNTQNAIYRIICLDNGHIVITYKTPILEIYSFQNNEIKKEFSLTTSCGYTSITSLTKNRFASVGSEDTKIRIWKGDIPYSETPIAELEGNYSETVCLIQLEGKEILAFAGEDVYLWDLNNYKCIKIIKKFIAKVFFTQLTDDIFASNGNLINIQTGEKTEFYKEWFTIIYEGIKLSNEKLLFGATYQDCDHEWSSDSICLFDLKTKKKYQKGVNGFIYNNPIIIGDHSFITIEENLINIWKY